LEVGIDVKELLKCLDGPAMRRKGKKTVRNVVDLA
jgi:hypothetical protein